MVEQLAYTLINVIEPAEKVELQLMDLKGEDFFSEELIDSIEKIAGSQHKENLLLLHRQLSTILSVVSSTRKVDLVKFKELCDTTLFHLCDNFTWVKLNHTLHGTLHHSVELINLNDGYALGNLSEECL